MNRELVNKIVCPECRSTELQLTEYVKNDFGICDGAITCSACSEWFRIENGILDLLPMDLRRLDLRVPFAKKYNLPFTEKEVKGHAQKLGQIKFFKEGLEEYEKNVAESSFYRALDAVTFERWVDSHLKPDDLTLSVGCGEGRQCMYLAQKGVRSIGLDICEEIVLSGKIKSDERGHSSLIDFVVADGENPPFRTNIFQATILLGAIHHLPNPRVAIKNIAATLCSRGLFFSMDPHDSPVRFIFDFMMRIWKLYDEEASDEPMISHKQLHLWLSEAGLTTNTFVTTYLPPHFLYPLTFSLNKFLLRISDWFFGLLPGVRNLGGVIYSDSIKKIE